MRGLAIFVLLAAVLVVALYYLRRLEQKQGPVPQGSAAAEPATATAAAPPSPTVAPAPATTPIVNRKSEVVALAKKARLEVIRYEQTGAAAVVDVQWSSDNLSQGADLIDLMLNEGMIRDFEQRPPPARQGQSPDGRRVLSSSFKVFFK